MRSILIVLMFGIASTGYAADTEYLTYDKFIQQVEQGNIKSVKFDRFSGIEGEIVEDGTIKNFNTYGHTGSASDPLLNRLLKEHNVPISIRDSEEPFQYYPMLTGCIFLITPVLILIFFIVVIRKLNLIITSQKSNQSVNGRDTSSIVR